ncbi:MAG: hypothetical protein JRE40_01090 [Deltaproteobacteria bacterium]|nr:hypothetical protein [Deltaproteobacteria bacterium]
MVKITLQFVVPAGFRKGDYAKLFWDAGGGVIDFDTPVDNRLYELFPSGAGIYGFGHAPFGRFRFGHGHAMRAIGFGHLPFGHFPFAYGSAQITAAHQVSACGTYKYAFKVYDAAGNPQSGDPDEISVTVHTAPAKPTGLKKQSYNNTTDVLTLEVA